MVIVRDEIKGHELNILLHLSSQYFVYFIQDECNPADVCDQVESGLLTYLALH